MFINAGIYKKIVKKAFKRGELNIAHVNGLYCIDTVHTALEVKEEFLSNKIKAGIIEMVGDLPAEGEAFTYSPEGKQAVMPHTIYEDIAAEYLSANFERDAVEFGNVIIVRDGVHQRVLQYTNNPRAYKMLVNDMYYGLIDYTAIEHQLGETRGGDPVINGSALVMNNNVMSFKCYLRKPKYKIEADILNSLEGIQTMWIGLPIEEIGYAE